MSDNAKQVHKDTVHHLNGRLGEGTFTLDFLSEDKDYIHFVLRADDEPTVTLTVRVDF